MNDSAVALPKRTRDGPLQKKHDTPAPMDQTPPRRPPAGPPGGGGAGVLSPFATAAAAPSPSARRPLFPDRAAPSPGR